MARDEVLFLFVIWLSCSVMVQSNQCAGTPCDCSQRYIVDCSGLGLTDIPEFRNNFFNTPIKLFNFSNNKFVTFDPNDFGINFADVPTIEFLDLSNNHLTSIANSFAVTDVVPSYEKLDLSNNKFTEFPGKALPLQFPHDVLEIDISNNQLTNLPTHFVANNVMQLIPSLTLNVRDNFIKNIHPMAFAGDVITELRLDVTNNKLRNISEDFFFPVSQNGEFKMSGNPWNCDCKFRWISASSFREKSVSSPPFCNDPSPLRNRNLFDLKEDEFVCQPKLQDVLGQVTNNNGGRNLSCPVTADPESSLDITWSFAVCQPTGNPVKVITRTKRVEIREGSCLQQSTCLAENYAGSIKINVNGIMTDDIKPCNVFDSGGKTVIMILSSLVVASFVLCFILGVYYAYLKMATLGKVSMA